MNVELQYRYSAMQKLFQLLGVYGLLLIFTCPSVAAQAEPSVRLEDRLSTLGYPGSMSLRTAFHQGRTTRFLLLKCSEKSIRLRKYLRLTSSQLNSIHNLKPLDANVVSQNRSRESSPALTDSNAEPDEQVINPKYFAFLTTDQLSRLDRVAFVFDGCAAITRTSVADRIDLPTAKKEELSAIVKMSREGVFLPFFRSRFPGRSDPNKCIDCLFVGKFITNLNHRLLHALSEDETKRLEEWMSDNSPPAEMIEELMELAPLPDGLMGVARGGVAKAPSAPED